jgi:hypothetical protein
MAEQKYPDSKYLEAELFDDGDAEVRCMTRKIVVTRKEHRCAFADAITKPHDIPVGTRAIRESAIVEGAWGSAYSCLTCVDKWLDHLAELRA